MEERVFWKVGHKITGHKLGLSKKVGMRKFKAFFGVRPNVCLVIWNKLEGTKPHDALPKHLMWTFYYLRHYDTEAKAKKILKADEKTIRKWVWMFISFISELEVIDFSKRKEDAQDDQKYFVSLDAMDCKIAKPALCNDFEKWHSVRCRTSGLRYEVGLCVQTGKIIWTNGGFPCGEYSDLAVAQKDYIHKVDKGELTLAKKAYKDPKYFIKASVKDNKTHKELLARHDVLLKRLKQFAILNTPYRNELSKHKMCFMAIINILEIAIENGDPLIEPPPESDP